jgi:uncharacterized membrane protein YbhN (UPF0104 family)
MLSSPAATRTIEASPVDWRPDEPASGRSRGRTAGLWAAAGAFALLVAGVLITATHVEGDSANDLAGLLGSVGMTLASMRWPLVSMVLALAAVHYVASAIAARSASGLPLPLAETFLVQLAAAAANRLTPAGIGASAVNARYFTRRGLRLPAALGAVAALGVLGAVADLLVLSLLVFVGPLLGLAGGPQEIQLLARHVLNLVAPLRSPWFWTIALVVAGALFVARIGSRRGGATDRWRQFWRPIRSLMRRKTSLGTLLAASGATTLVLGIAFVVSTAMVPGPRPHATFGALLIGFMVGSAAGSAVPVPAGFGSTELALVAVLTQLRVPASHAIEEVLIFRVLTFWLPAALGVLAARRLNRRHAL